MSGNVLIEASAGTGKTQALAERLIALIRGGVKPQEIVALTFSRAAAGEIFERFVSLLADRAEADPHAVAFLREVIATQHLSQIGTLDSFLMRIVRSFPLELGLSGPLEIMDEYASAAERARVSFGILRRTDAALKAAFDEAFALAMNQENVRSFTETYRAFVKDWHERFLSMPEPQAWGNAAKLGVDERCRCRAEDLSDFADALEGFDESKVWREFVQWVRDFRGSFAGATKGLAKKFLELGEDLFTGATMEVSFNRKPYVFSGARAAAIRAAFAAIFGMVLRMRLARARGIYTLVRSFEAEYAKRVRMAGRLVFADVPRLILGLNESARQALEYRMDSKIRAWALDEFQDTSREQWKALSGLIEEAKQSVGEKSLFVVGDRKQAIYGWRNGDVGIFTRERTSGVYVVDELKKTWRSGPAVVEAVNRVFVRGRLATEFPGWEAPEHETARPERNGFVQVVESAGRKKEDFVEPVFNALRAVDPVARGLSAAILVRTNPMGEMLAAALKAKGLKGVIWEGESAILDTPALVAFLDTLSLAEHPGDGQAYEHFLRSPLATAKYGAVIPDAATISGEFALAFATKGLVRTFRELRATLPKDPSVAWSAFTEDRFTDLLRAAAEFERTMEAGVRLVDFISYLRSCKKRNVAEPGKIKIMTIHRSKGLGFDYVVLPIYEPEAIDREPDGPLIGEDWILPDPGERISSVYPILKDAAERRQERSEQEELCAYYVAMTRAMRAMTLVLHPAAKTDSSTRRFSQFVRESLSEPIGDPKWYQDFKVEVHDTKRDGSAGSSNRETSEPQRRKRVFVKRRLPSLSFQTGESAGDLFAAANARQAALERGISVHAAYEKVEWMDLAAATNDLERALVKPSDDATLWREKPFEIRVGDEWISGRFDRVVFTGTGANLRATIYDFKTNAKRPNESETDLMLRLAENYRGQLMAYRRALSLLSGISMEKISCFLLLSSIQKSCQVS